MQKAKWMFRSFLQVDLLKHNIPDPSLLTLSASQDKENKNDDQSGSEDYLSDLCFVHARSVTCCYDPFFLLGKLI
jgi:protein SMG9